MLLLQGLRLGLKIMLTSTGKARTPVPAATPACLARGAMSPGRTRRRGRRRASRLSSTKRAGAISDRGWGRDFDDPMTVPNGRKLVTLRDAATYITRLSKAEHAPPEWQAAMEALLLVADRGGPTMLARIGVMRALNRHVERVFDPSRKEKHSGQAQTRARSMKQEAVGVVA
jgi:hypothetical protein